MSQEIDPSEFVQRIRQLGEQRDQQDAERVKKLEEDLIQGRSERLARRAGGCMSLLVLTPLMFCSKQSERAPSPPINPQRHSHRNEAQCTHRSRCKRNRSAPPRPP